MEIISSTMKWKNTRILLLSFILVILGDNLQDFTKITWVWERDGMVVCFVSPKGTTSEIYFCFLLATQYRTYIFKVTVLFVYFE